MASSGQAAALAGVWRERQISRSPGLDQIFRTVASIDGWAVDAAPGNGDYRDRIVSELGPVPDKGCFIVPGSR
jgi:hypothetical protein